MANEEIEQLPLMSASQDVEESTGVVLLPGVPPKKRAVTVATVKKWIMMYDDSLETSSWMKFEKSDEFHVSRLKCSICQLFESDLRKYSRNFSSAFIEGSENLRTSGFQDHAKSEMHKRAMSYWKRGLNSYRTGISFVGEVNMDVGGQDKVLPLIVYTCMCVEHISSEYW